MSKQCSHHARIYISCFRFTSHSSVVTTSDILNNVFYVVLTYNTFCIMDGNYAGNAFVIYGVTGFFGAAYYGTSTQANILVNHWLGGGVAQGILNLCMTCTNPPLLQFL